MSLLGEIERNAPAVGDLGVLRFITAGSVDDGKSTLIGRLLHDTRAILQDQLAAVARASSKRGQEDIDLSLLTDGLEAEREQGITIDVAYRYFATPRRKFIIADTPGHEQYTRNMVTGASIADAAVILIDARKGVLTQTRRHAAIAHLLGVRHVIVAVNKMDLVNYDEAVFERIRKEFLAFASALGIADLCFIPISALRGDMLADPKRPARTTKAIEARICWLSTQLLAAGALPAARFVLKHTTRSVKARLVSLNSRIDVNTLEQQAAPAGLAMNDIAHVTLALAQPLFVDSYELNRATGCFILIDEVSKQTVAAGMIDW